jgi:hypothetical protein
MLHAGHAHQRIFDTLALLEALWRLTIKLSSRKELFSLSILDPIWRIINAGKEHNFRSAGNSERESMIAMNFSEAC